MDVKTKILALLENASYERAGVGKLAEWLQTTDFFTAPASTRFHGAYEGGLAEHSLNVYSAYLTLFGANGDETSVILCTLLHDVCKCNFYTTEMRNRKNEHGVWERVPFYAVEDQFPYGHGEKSVFLIERWVRLKTEEAVAIRWHMGGFDEAVKGGSFAISGAYEKYPMAVKLHMADLYATYILESRGT